MALEKEKNLLMEKQRREKHERDLEALRQEFREANPEQPVPSSYSKLQVEREKQLYRHQRRMVSDPSSPDGAIPEYLLSSLNSARSSMGHRSPTNVYNITINQPQNVTIAASANNGNVAPSVGIEQTCPTTQKNIAVNADK